MPFMYFMVKTTNGPCRFRCEKEIASSYLLLYRASIKMRDRHLKKTCNYYFNLLYYQLKKAARIVEDYY